MTFRPFVAADFLDAVLSYSGSSDCTALSGLQLSAGTTCTLGIEFNPQQVGYLSGYVNVVDNSQNAQGPAYATQVIPVVGTGIPKTTGSPTLTALVVSPSPALLGASVTLTATVATSGTKTPTGMVTFKDGPTVLGATALNGSAVATYSTSSLAQGSHGLTAVYGGDANNAGSTSTIVGEPVNLATTTTVVASNLNPALTGSFITFTATVTTNGPKVLVGSVKFMDGSTQIGTSSLNGSGVGSCTVSNLVVGQHSITAVYSGDYYNSAGTSAVLIQVMNGNTTTTTVTSWLNPARLGASVLFGAAVTSKFSITPTGTLTFYDGSTVIGTATLSANTYSTSNLSLGQHSITAVYSGDSFYATSTSPVLIETITATAPTSTTLATSANPSTFGSPVTFATVVTTTGSKTPTGTVTFKDGTTVIGGVTLNSFGAATFTISTLAVGQHSMIVAYGGDANNAGSTSTVLTETVNPVPASTSTSLASSLNPSTSGSFVTFTAAVTTSGSKTPTGIVSFMDGATVLGASILNGSGVATYTTSILAVGQHSMTAAYGGDTNNSGCTSAALTQVVNGIQTNPVPSVSSLAPASAPAGDGAFTLTVNGSNFISSSTVLWNGSVRTATYISSAQLQAAITAADIATAGTASVTVSNPTPGGGTSGSLNFSISSAGIITTLAGNGTQGYSGDNGPGTGAQLDYPYSVAVDQFGNVFISDSANNVIREVTPSGAITTVSASAGVLNFPHGITVDASGNLYVADHGNQCVRRISPNGIVTTIAGNGTQGYSGDNGPATGAELNRPFAVALDSNGNLYIADYGNNVIRRVTANGTISTVAGNGTQGYSGDNGPAISAELNEPFALTVDSTGNLYIAEYGNNVIRKVTPAGTISTAVGTGAGGYNGDNIPASTAELYNPAGVVFDSNGDLFISDSDNERVREVTPAGIITTVAGNGHLGYSGDNGPATGAQMFMPLGIALDGGGNLYLADYGNSVVRKVTYKSWSQTTTNVTADLNPAPVGGSINFTAGIATLGLISPTGMVTFMDGSVTLGTGALNASGQATYATSNIGIGQHSITAVYAGDGNNAGSISAVLMENINAADFTFSSSPASATVTAGQSGTFTLTVTPQGSFSSPISFSCTGLPTLAACQFSPGAVTPNSCTVTTALTITTMPRSAALALPSSGQRSSPLFAIWLALPSMVGIVLLPAPKRRKLASALFVCLVAGSCLFQVACGGTSNGGSGGGGGTGGTPVGTYTVSVIGGAGSSQHSTTVTLTIQ